MDSEDSFPTAPPRVSFMFAARNYTNLFCHAKKLSHFGMDTKASSIERHVVLDVDNKMREASFIGGVVGGIFTTVAFSTSLLTNGHANKALYSVRCAAVVVGLYYIKDISNFWSHFAMLTRMPHIYNCYLNGVTNDSFIYKETSALLENLRDNPEF